MHALVMVINGKKCTSELMKRISGWLSLIGYVFIAGVAIISALQVTINVLKCLLILSAMVSLVLAVTRFISARKMNARIKYLEEHHLSVIPDVENEELIIKEGIGNNGAGS